MSSGLLLQCYIHLLIIIHITIIPLLALEESTEDSYSTSLYNKDDKITILTKDNFFKLVEGSKTFWLIEFYASWCGHCQSYANVYRDLALDAFPWNVVIRVGAINCYGEERSDVCRRCNVRFYPRLALVPPNNVFDNSSKMVMLSSNQSSDVKGEIFRILERLFGRNQLWPNFKPVNRVTFEDLYARSSKTVKILLLIVEKREDLTGRQIMMDFFKYNQHLAIFRTTTDGRLWRKLNITKFEVPALFSILQNRTVHRINLQKNSSNLLDNRQVLHQAVRSYLENSKLIDNFNDSDWDELIQGKINLRNKEREDKLRKSKISKEELTIAQSNYQKVNMIDLEMALQYMLRQEIPLIHDIRGLIYDKLIQWLNILIKYFPGRTSTMFHLQQLYKKVLEKPMGFTGDEFLMMTDSNFDKSSRLNHSYGYKQCKGSAPQYRGYPCSLWLLFHTLTVSQAKRNIQNQSLTFNVTEIPVAVRNYVEFFFSCRHCKENFIKETSAMDQMDLNNQYEAVIYLWKIHNSVNQRLHGSSSEDPKFPKIQFPDQYLCLKCHSINSSESHPNFDLSETVHFLFDYFSPDLSENEVSFERDKQQGDQRMRRLWEPAINQNIISQLDSHSLVMTMYQQYFSWYLLLVIVIGVLFYRIRCFRNRSKPHTV